MTRAPDEARTSDMDPTRFLRRILHRDDPEGVLRTALSGRDAAGDLTYAELARAAAGVARTMAADGVRPGDRVALMAPYGPGWVATLLGVLSCGAVAVPLSPDLAAGETAALLKDADPALVVGDEQRARTALEMAGLDARAQPLAVAPPYPQHAWSATPRRPDDPVMIVYTSGATGAPKGVVVSWANLVYQVIVASERMRASTEPVLVSILPAHHLLELTAGVLGPLYLGGRVHYPGSMLPRDILSAVAAQRASELVVVPLFLTALRRRFEGELARASRFERGYLRASRRVAAGLPFRLRRLVLAPLHARLGGRLKRFYVGGAPLDAKLTEYFRDLGFHVCQGYGLSEASPMVSCNAPGQNRLGSVGRPLPGTKTRIGADGEILVRGPGVMGGYWRAPQLTAEAIDDQGWLRTGDVGFLDRDGYLFVTGRAKNLIVLAGGENVQPEEVETAVRRSELVGDVCVLGRPRPRGEEVVAVVTASAAARERFAAVDLVRALVAEVRRFSADLAPYKRPSQIVVHDQDLPQTSTRKVRRADVQELVGFQERVHAHG